MILVIGGRGAGKRSFVTDVLGFSPEQFAENGPVLYGLEELDPLPPLEARKAGAALITCLFLVTGILCLVSTAVAGCMPWREAVGRLCCALAREAEAVYRLQCGLAMRLK